MPPMWKNGSGVQKRSSRASPSALGEALALGDEREVAMDAALGIRRRARRVEHERVVVGPEGGLRGGDFAGLDAAGAGGERRLVRADDDPARCPPRRARAGRPPSGAR